jgi:uncharacterized membrane protein YphA (DoxX/SURF4 family)
MKVSFELNLKTILRWILGLIFIWAAISKLANLQDFYSSLTAYKLLLPEGWLRSIAITLPWLELFCGLMLLFRFWFRAAISWSVALCALFIVSTGQAWARGLDISCGCLDLELFGLSGEANSSAARFFQSPAFACMRAIGLAGAAVYLLRNASGEAAAGPGRVTK